MIFDLSALYERCQARLEDERKAWGEDPHFYPRFRFERGDVYAEARESAFYFFVARRPGVPFAIVNADHALIRFPQWRQLAQTARRCGGAYESGILHQFFNLRAYAGNPNRPGHDFHICDGPNEGVRVHTTEWVWSDGTELRPHGVQFERVLKRKALKGVKTHIAQAVEPARVAARLCDTTTECSWGPQIEEARRKAADLIVQGDEVNAAELKTLLARSTWGYDHDAKRIDRALREMREDLWRGLGAVQLVEKEPT